MADSRSFTDSRQFRVMSGVIGALNPLTRRLIESRLGGPLNRQLLVLRYRGRRSGRTVTTPVGYVRDGNTVVLVTSASYQWWQNFVGGGDADLRLPDGWHPAHLEVLAPDDPRFADAVALQVAQRGPAMLRGFGLEVDDLGRVADGPPAAGSGQARIVLATLVRARAR